MVASARTCARIHPLREVSIGRCAEGERRSMIEALALLFGIAILAATAWCPPGATRLLGAALFALLSAVVLRFAIGIPLGIASAVLLGALAYRFLPLLVLRRVVFLVPALVLLIFATTLLMYRAPGNPFANERATSAPGRDGAPRAVRCAQERARVLRHLHAPLARAGHARSLD